MAYGYAERIKQYEAFKRELLNQDVVLSADYYQKILKILADVLEV